MRRFDLAVVFAATGLLPACATVVRGTQQDVSIVSEPPAALASLSNGMSCTTPCKLELDREKDVTVTVSKPGYTPSQTQIVSKMRGSDYLLGIGGNLMVGGIIGAVVDGSNGSLRSLEPSPLHVKLEPLGSAAVRTVLTSTAFQAAAAQAGAACQSVPGADGFASLTVAPGPGEKRNIVVCGDPYAK